MIQKTIWISDDGLEFDTKDQCYEYEENVLKAIEKILSSLNPHSSIYGVKQEKERVEKAFEEFMSLCAKNIPSRKVIFDKAIEGDVHMSHIERIISDWSNDFPAFSKVLYRFNCISHKTWIEYPQPYYVSHEEEFKEKII